MELLVCAMTAECTFLVRCDVYDANEVFVARDPAFTQTKTQTKVGIVMPHFPYRLLDAPPPPLNTTYSPTNCRWLSMRWHSCTVEVSFTWT